MYGYVWYECALQKTNNNRLGVEQKGFFCGCLGWYFLFYSEHKQKILSLITQPRNGRWMFSIERIIIIKINKT